MNRNGTATRDEHTTGIPTVEQADPRTELDAWDDAITDLDTALAEAAAARLALDQLHRTLERIEASAVLSIEGGNAETRKARLTLALAGDARHQQTVSSIEAERCRLLDAERRLQVSKERCRLLRASVSLTSQD